MRLEESALKSLDSSMKKVTPFLKKVKERLGEETRAQLLTELAKLNLSKYVEEVALAVSEAKLKVADIPAATAVCSAMHAAYAPFAAALMPHLLKNATLTAPPPARPGAPPTPPEPDADRSARLARKRSSLRLLFELVAVGVFTDSARVVGCLVEVVIEDGVPMAEPPMPNLAVVSSVAKAVLIDPLLVSPATRAAAAAASRTADAGSAGEAVACALTPTEQRKLVTTVLEYFKTSCAALQQGWTALRAIEKANQRALHIKGDLSEVSG